VGRRRPSGELPPLPHHLQISGVGWLLAAVGLIVLAIMVFGRGMRGPAVAVTVADDAVVRWLAGLQAPGLLVVKRALAALSSWWVLNGLALVLVLALLALRRFRHLIVFIIFTSVVVLFAANMVGAFARRPRPFGVAIQTGWGGWALPSLQVTFFATILVAILYTLVPEGRWRNTGKRVAAALRWAPTPRPMCWLRRPSVSPSRCWPSAGSPPPRCSRSPTGGAAAPTWTLPGRGGWRSGGD